MVHVGGEGTEEEGWIYDLWLSARAVFLEVTRGTRASNPLGTCVSRAIQRAAHARMRTES